MPSYVEARSLSQFGAALYVAVLVLGAWIFMLPLISNYWSSAILVVCVLGLQVPCLLSLERQLQCGCNPRSFQEVKDVGYIPWGLRKWLPTSPKRSKQLGSLVLIYMLVGSVSTWLYSCVMGHHPSKLTSGIFVGAILGLVHTVRLVTSGGLEVHTPVQQRKRYFRARQLVPKMVHQVGLGFFDAGGVHGESK